MSMHPSFQRVLNWIGSGLSITCVLFVILKLRAYCTNLNLSSITGLAWCLIVMVAAIYGAANTLLSLAWRNLLRQNRASITSVEAIRIYGISQLARYLPGNIFHLAGRQALGMAAGIPSGALARSMIWELSLIAFTGSLFGWLILPIAVSGVHEVAGLFFLIVSALIIAVLLDHIMNRKIMWSFLLQLLFLAVSAGVFTALIYVISGGEGLSVENHLMIGGAYIVAWLVGLVTPGAPAGVGVREMILLLLLKGMVTETDLLTTVLLSRAVTVVGDIVFFLAASTISVKYYYLTRKEK